MPETRNSAKAHLAAAALAHPEIRPTLMPVLREARGDIPKTVEDYAKEVAEGNPGYDDAKVWATAWSIYCEYKEPGSPHCHQDDYFSGKTAARGRGPRDKQQWMKQYVELTGDPQPKPRDYWDTATYLFNQGQTPEEAASRFRKVAGYPSFSEGGPETTRKIRDDIIKDMSYSGVRLEPATSSNVLIVDGHRFAIHGQWIEGPKGIKTQIRAGNHSMFVRQAARWISLQVHRTLADKVARLACRSETLRPKLLSILREAATVDPSTLAKVGDILSSSWGYDQTNIDFYEIVGFTRTMVALRKIAKKIVRSSGTQDYVVPIPGQYTGPVIRRKAGTGWRGGLYVSINSYAGASTWDGEPEAQTDPRYGH